MAETKKPQEVKVTGTSSADILRIADNAPAGQGAFVEIKMGLHGADGNEITESTIAKNKIIGVSDEELSVKIKEATGYAVVGQPTLYSPTEIHPTEVTPKDDKLVLPFSDSSSLTSQFLEVQAPHYPRPAYSHQGPPQDGIGNDRIKIDVEHPKPDGHISYVATGGMKLTAELNPGDGVVKEMQQITGLETEIPSLLLLESTDRISEQTRDMMTDPIYSSPIQRLTHLHESQNISGLAAEVITRDGNQYLRFAKLGLNKPYVLLVQEPTQDANGSYPIRAQPIPNHDIKHAEVQIFPGQRIAIIDETTFGDPKIAKPLVDANGRLQVPPLEKYLTRRETVFSFLADLSYQLNWGGRHILVAGFEVPTSKNDIFRALQGGQAEGHLASMQEDAHFSNAHIESRTYNAIYDTTTAEGQIHHHQETARLLQSSVDLVTLDTPGVFLGGRGHGEVASQYPIVVDLRYDRDLLQTATGLRAALTQFRKSLPFYTLSQEGHTRVVLEMVKTHSLYGTRRDDTEDVERIQRFERRYLSGHPGVTAIPVGAYKDVVCLQLAAKSGALAAEMVREGFFGNKKVEIRLRRSYYKPSIFQRGGGHAFAVAFVYDEQGKVPTPWVIDPMNDFVGTLDDAKKLSHAVGDNRLLGYYEAIRDHLQVLE